MRERRKGLAEMSLTDRETLLREARRLGVRNGDAMSTEALEREVKRAQGRRPQGSFWTRVFRRVRGALCSDAATGSGHPADAAQRPSPAAAAKEPADAQASSEGEAQSAKPDQGAEPIATRTMAGLLAAQGHEERALRIYDQLLEDATAADAAAIRDEADALRRRLEARGQSEDPTAPVVLVRSKRSGVLLAWEVPDAPLRRATALLPPGSSTAAAGPETILELTVRAVIIIPDVDLGARVETWEKPAKATGEWVLGSLPSGSRVTGAVGFRSGAQFVSASHSTVLSV